MKDKANEPWAAWSEHVQSWMGNPAAMNPFAMPTSPPAAGFGNPFTMGGNPLDPQAMMKAIDPTEIERRIAEMRAVETWLKFSLSTLEMSIKTMEMQRDAYASFAKMNASAKESMAASAQSTAEAMRKTMKPAARTTAKKAARK